MNNKTLFLLLIILMTGCITEFDFEFEKFKPRLVVDAVITNQPGPYIIRLTESKIGDNIKVGNGYIDNATGVTNALIILSDNQGQIDTLLPVVFDPQNEFITPERGYYKTNTIKGIAGQTYFLKIIAEEQEYSATSIMPEVPEIDSLSYLREFVAVKNKDNLIPVISFKEPQNDQNYYLINHYESVDYVEKGYAENFLWRYSILSDEYLEPYVKELHVENGSVHNDLGYYPYTDGNEIVVRLYSLTKEAYLYYEVLLKQFEEDGGTYKPSPASPPTNISNGGLGFFRASAVSERSVKIPGLPLAKP